MISKKPTPKYILDARRGGLTYDEAIEKILEENGVESYPIPIVAIAKGMGFAVYSAEFGYGVFGIMMDCACPPMPFNEKRMICFNKNEYATRQSFVVAHEIAHFVLHCNEKDDFYEKCVAGKAGKSAAEDMANIFARKLLMPQRMVQELVDMLPVTISRAQLVSIVAARFWVPEEVADLRLAEMGYGPVFCQN